MKYITYIRDDYFYFSRDYNNLLLKPLWSISPSAAFFENKGMQFMTCKDINSDSAALLFIHQDYLIIFYLVTCDKICHAVIKPRINTLQAPVNDTYSPKKPKEWYSTHISEQREQVDNN